MKQRGYTLIEVLIALLIFAIITSTTGTVVYQVLNTRERVAVVSNELNALELALLRVTQDLRQFVARSVHDAQNQRYAEFVGQRTYLEFTRDGLQHPLNTNPESSLERIAYLCEGSQLVRRRFSGLDIPSRQSFEDTVILDQLSTCYFEYLADYNQFLPEWRVYFIEARHKVLAMPKAVQLTLEPAHWGVLSRLFLLPGGT